MIWAGEYKWQIKLIFLAITSLIYKVEAGEVVSLNEAPTEEEAKELEKEVPMWLSCSRDYRAFQKVSEHGFVTKILTTTCNTVKTKYIP